MIMIMMIMMINDNNNNDDNDNDDNDDNDDDNDNDDNDDNDDNNNKYEYKRNLNLVQPSGEVDKHGYSLCNLPAGYKRPFSSWLCSSPRCS